MPRRSVGAAIALAAVADDLGLRVTLLGTPAEEGGGGKLQLIDAGAFDGVHAALMVHPGPDDIVAPEILAVQQLDIAYTGREAHAAGFPELGVNAADALVIAQAAIGLLRQHLMPGDRVHGIVTKGGDAANIVPAHTTASFMTRSTTRERLVELTARVRSCFEAGALATGAELTFVEGVAYADMLHDPDLVALYRRNAEAIGRHFPPGAAMTVSTDMGDVSHVVPSIHPMIGIDSRPAVNHQPDFSRAAVMPAADQAIFDGAVALAWTAIDAAMDAAIRDRLLGSAHVALLPGAAFHEVIPFPAAPAPIEVSGPEDLAWLTRVEPESAFAERDYSSFQPERSEDREVGMPEDQTESERAAIEAEAALAASSELAAFESWVPDVEPELAAFDSAPIASIEPELTEVAEVRPELAAFGTEAAGEPELGTIPPERTEATEGEPEHRLETPIETLAEVAGEPHEHAGNHRHAAEDLQALPVGQADLDSAEWADLVTSVPESESLPAVAATGADLFADATVSEAESDGTADLPSVELPSDSQPEVNAEAERVADAEPVAEPDLVAEPEPVAVAEFVAEPEPVAVAEFVAEFIAEPDLDLVAEVVAEAEPEAEPVAELVAEPESEPVAELEPVAVAEFAGEPEPQPELNAEAVAEFAAEAEPDLVAEPELVAEAVAEFVAEPELEPVAVAEFAGEPEPQPEWNAEAVAEFAAEPEPVAETEFVAEPEPEPELVAELVAEPEPEPVAVAEFVAEPEPEPELVAELVAAEPEPIAVAEFVAVAEPEPELVAELVAEPEPEPVAEAEFVAEPEPEPEPELVAELVAQPEPEPELVAELVAEFEPVAVAEFVAEPEPDLVAELEPVAVAEFVAEPEPEPELVAELVAEPEPEPVAVAEFVAEPEPEPELVAELVAEPEPELEPVAVAEFVAEPEPDLVAELEPVAVAEFAATEPGRRARAGRRRRVCRRTGARTRVGRRAVAELAAEPEPVADAEFVAEPEPVGEAQLAAEPEPEPVAELEPVAVAEFAGEPEPQPEWNAEAVAEFAAEPEPVAEAEFVAEPEPEPELVAELVAEPEPEPVAVAEFG